MAQPNYRPHHRAFIAVDPLSTYDDDEKMDPPPPPANAKKLVREHLSRFEVYGPLLFLGIMAVGAVTATIIYNRRAQKEKVWNSEARQKRLRDLVKGPE